MDKTFFDDPGKNDLRKDDKIQKIKTGQGDDYTTGCLLEFFFFSQKILQDDSNRIK